MVERVVGVFHCIFYDWTFGYWDLEDGGAIWGKVLRRVCVSSMNYEVVDI